jgi:hypothetical protein
MARKRMEAVASLRPLHWPIVATERARYDAPRARFFTFAGRPDNPGYRSGAILIGHVWNRWIDWL